MVDIVRQDKSSEVIAGEITVAWINRIFEKWNRPPTQPKDAGTTDGKTVGEFFETVYKKIEGATRG